MLTVRPLASGPALLARSSGPGVGAGHDGEARSMIHGLIVVGHTSPTHTSLAPMPWWFQVIESKHEFQNPTSRDKILLLGERLGLGPTSHVLDMGAGRGGPAVLLAGSFGCRVTCVEQSEEFLEAAKDNVGKADLGRLVELVHSDGKEFAIDPEHYDVAMCHPRLTTGIGTSPCIGSRSRNGCTSIPTIPMWAASGCRAGDIATPI